MTDIEQTPEEQTIERDEQAVADTDLAPEEPVAEEPTEPAKVAYLEFVGVKPHGTEFYGQHGTHTVARKDLREFHDIDTPKDLVWKRGRNDRFLVPVSDMSPEAAEFLAGDEMFKRVEL